jgi:mRNA interferase MazF
VVEVMRRGEVWVANLNPSRGGEIGKVRPIVIMQADELIAAECPMVVVLPLTTQIHPGLARFRITHRSGAGSIADGFPGSGGSAALT